MMVQVYCNQFTVRFDDVFLNIAQWELLLARLFLVILVILSVPELTGSLPITQQICASRQSK